MRNKQQIDKQRGLNKHYYISQGQFSNIPGVEKWKEELLLEENSTDECVKKYAEKLIKDVTKQMKKAAAELNFEAAAELRDKLIELKQILNEIE